MRQTGQGSNASPQNISGQLGGKHLREVVLRNLRPSLQAPLLEEQKLEKMLSQMQDPGAHPAFVGPVRGQGERAEESDFVVACARPDAKRLDGRDCLGPLQRAVQQALELHPSLRPTPVPRIFIKGQHESERESVLSLLQPIVLAAAKVLSLLSSIQRCHALLDAW